MIKVPDEYKSIYKLKKFITLVTGGRGSAKSFNVALFLLRLTYEIGHRILYTRYTMTSAEISIIPEFKNKLELEGIESDFVVTKKDIINKRTGSRIMFRGIKTSSGNQTANLKSIQGLTTFVVDEAEEWESEEDYDTILLSIRELSATNRVIVIMNPSHRRHFIYQKYIKDTNKKINIDGFEVEVSTNERVNHIHTWYKKYEKYLSQNFLEEIDVLKLDRDKYGHSVIGQWQDNPDGLMYPNINYFDHDLPEGANYSFTDVADTGDDYLCTWFVRFTGSGVFIYDAVYTKDQGSGQTIPLLSNKMISNNCVVNWIESNNQGSVFISQLSNTVPGIDGKFESTNKVKRIYAYSHYINFVKFRSTGSPEYLKAIEHLKLLPKSIPNNGRGMDVDSADALTAMLRYINYNYKHYFLIK